jgi:hypothetical protein
MVNLRYSYNLIPENIKERSFFESFHLNDDYLSCTIKDSYLPKYFKFGFLIKKSYGPRTFYDVQITKTENVLITVK